MRRVVDADAALFMGCALTNALGVTGLVRAFGYPGMLNDPAGATLAAVGSRTGTLTLFALLTAVSAVLIVPLTTRIVRLGAMPGPARPAAHPNRTAWVLLLTGLATATAMIFEWCFWLIGVPLLTRNPAGPGPISPSVITFDALRVTLGVLCGETIGPLLLSAWTVLVASRFVASVFDDWWPLAPARPGHSPLGGHGSLAGRPGGRGPLDRRPGVRDLLGRGLVGSGLVERGRRSVAAAADWLRLEVLRWARPVLIGSGLACAGLLFAAAASAAGLLPAPRLAALARLLWSLWLAGIGALVWVSRARGAGPRHGAAARGLALGLPWRAGGPRAAVRPRPFQRTPFRYAAYRAAAAARSRALPGHRPGRHGGGAELWGTAGGLVGTGGDDAVTEAGDEAVVDVGPRARARVAAAETYADAHAAADTDSGSSSGSGTDSDTDTGEAEDRVDPPTEIVTGNGEGDAAGDHEPTDAPESAQG
ncbi:hypothetical protein [Parafrankia discariae]|uniref:hypothetical protein n=1 Tax=Parafrankia discariae TaxID=365528 RepID=UPI0003A9CDEA|nr:hypothetical protein [Parafrankia discariae]